MSGCAVSRGGARAVSGDGGVVRAQVDARHRRRGRPGRGPRMPLYLVRHAVPPALLQLWYVANYSKKLLEHKVFQI